MEVIWAAIGGFALDLLLGDPRWMPHPVVLMGRCISFLEKGLRRLFSPSHRGELMAGGVLAALLPLATLALTGGALWLCGEIHPGLRFGLEVLWCWQALAARGLWDESRNVWRQLSCGTLEDGQRAVGRIVGRDTRRLDEPGVIRAAVETVAENCSDGVIAPLFYMLIGGAPLAMTYKAINTMDSMVGYRNDRYLFFGRAAARLDDGANLIPSRVGGLLLVLAAGLTGHSAGGAWRIWRRDRRKHTSPNSAQTESAMAGALGVRLAGPTWYFGRLCEKPWIGDGLRPVEREDILRAGRMMYAASALGLLLFCGLRWLAIAVLSG